jgi:adenosylcobinamide kinase/adenosylcobinamide-phosphate guanylyltransferase
MYIPGEGSLGVAGRPFSPAPLLFYQGHRMTESRGRIVFVIGGARSGKSSFALGRASALEGKKIYIATAQAFDDEMTDRIKHHKEERSNSWDTIEEPVRIADAFRSASSNYDVVVIDCLTLWLSNLLCGNSDAEKEFEVFLDSLRVADRSSQVYIVSNEVGQGIVPDNALARRFRDLAGHLNRKVAGIADEVYLVTAGIPIKIKP